MDLTLYLVTIAETSLLVVGLYVAGREVRAARAATKATRAACDRLSERLEAARYQLEQHAQDKAERHALRSAAVSKGNKTRSARRAELAA